MTRARRSAAAAAVAVAAMAAAGGTAGAHDEGMVAATAVVDSVTPQIDGLTVRTKLGIAPVVEIENRGDREVVVLGERGEPFLRVSARGVLVNHRSPTLYRSRDPFDAGSVPRGARRAARPDWRRGGSLPRWQWFDPRLRVRGGRPTPFVLTLRSGGREVKVRGHSQMGEVGHFRGALEPVRKVEGLDLRLTDASTPALYVSNATGRVLEVQGPDGEPLLRIGPGGTRANLRSRSYRVVAEGALRPADRRRPGRPRWRTLSAQPMWGWLEPRGRVPGRGRLPESLDRRQTLLRWTTPMTLAGRPLLVRGSVEWMPMPQAAAGAARTADGRAVTGGMAAAGALAVAALAALARRRRVRSKRA